MGALGWLAFLGFGGSPAPPTTVILTDPTWVVVATPQAMTVTAEVFGSIITAPARPWLRFAPTPATGSPEAIFLGGWVAEGWVEAGWIELVTIFTSPILHTNAVGRTMTVVASIDVSVVTAPVRSMALVASTDAVLV